MTISYLKKRILVQGQGGREVQTGGIRQYFEDLNRAPNPAKGGRPKDFFEIAYRKPLDTSPAFFYKFWYLALP
jgi:hypothetical protein